MYESFYNYEYNKHNLEFTIPNEFSYVHFSNVGKGDSESIPITLFAKTPGLATAVNYKMYINNDSSTENEDDIQETRYIPIVKLLSDSIGTLLSQIAEEAAAEEERRLEKLRNTIVIKEEDDEIIMAKSVKKAERTLWTEKYIPRKFHELMSYQKINREILTWLKAWDPIVFKDRKGIEEEKRQVMGTPAKNPDGKPNNFYFVTPNKNHISQKATYNIRDEGSIKYLQNKLILLSGPPGTGKTTIARIIAKQCGYEPYEINASDDRSGNAILSKIGVLSTHQSINLVKTSSLNTQNRIKGRLKQIKEELQKDDLTNDRIKELRKEQLQEEKNFVDIQEQIRQEQVKKPKLLIIDEVDGALESESKGALGKILEYVYASNNNKNKNKKPSKQQQKKQRTNGLKPKPMLPAKSAYKLKKNFEKTKRLKLLRPIIFICNDPYSKGLKKLRQNVITFYFNKIQTQKLLPFLKEICLKEGFYIDYQTLKTVVQQQNNDIRSCLNMLQYLSKKQAQKNSCTKLSLENSHQTVLIQKNIFDLVNKIFNSINYTKLMKSQNLIPAVQERQMMRFCFRNLGRGIDMRFLVNTIFENYHLFRPSSSYFHRMPEILDQFINFDRNQVLERTKQMFSLRQFNGVIPFSIFIHFQNRCFLS